MPGSMTDGNPNDARPDKRIVRIVVPGRAMNMAVSRQEREFLDRLSKAMFAAVDGSQHVHAPAFEVHDLEEPSYPGEWR